MSNKIVRKQSEYKNTSEKFTENISNADYSKQYCSIYLERLNDMELLLRQTIAKKWNNQYPICKLHKLTEEQYDKCIVIGTLFKDQKLKPSVLKQLAESNQLLPQPILTHFTDETDVLFLEDEVQRYQVVGNINSSNLVTGITCALLGSDIGKGKFNVEETIFIGLRDQIERPLLQDSTYILFISGINFIDHEKSFINLQMVLYWISGYFDVNDNITKLSRIIISGNSIRNKPKKQKPTISMISKVPEPQDTIDAVQSFDKFLMKLCQVIDVDLMPGEYDPTNHILPQQPIHYCILPNASEYKSCNLVTNPYSFELDGIKILGTSGQPINDIMKFSNIEKSINAMENCLEWNHLAPTAPDTLGCYPYYSKDPFIIDECPHLFFAGNQKDYEQKTVQGDNGQNVSLISIPDFSETLQCVLVDLKTLNSKVIEFKSELSK